MLKRTDKGEGGSKPGGWAKVGLAVCGLFVLLVVCSQLEDGGEDMGGASDATEAPDNGLTGDQLAAAFCDGMRELSFQEMNRQFMGMFGRGATTMEEVRSNREARDLFIENARFCRHPWAVFITPSFVTPP